MDLVTPKAAAKHELLFNKPGSAKNVNAAPNQVKKRFLCKNRNGKKQS
jgi:hypothetical protein